MWPPTNGTALLLDDHLDGQVLQGEGRGEYRDLRLDAEPVAGYNHLERAGWHGHACVAMVCETPDANCAQQVRA